MGRNAIPAVFGVLIVALCLSQVAIFVRVGRLQEQYEKAGRERPAAPNVTSPLPADAAVPPAVLVPSSESSPAPGPSPAVPAAKDPVTVEQVEEIVGRVLKERDEKNPWNQFMRAAREDPVTVMERELGLSPAQKMRIKEHWDARRKALEEMTDWSRNRFREIDEAYLAALKGELSADQWQKYQELKRSGKIFDTFVGGWRPGGRPEGE